jgi:hypothetical protein
MRTRISQIRMITCWLSRVVMRSTLPAVALFLGGVVDPAAAQDRFVLSQPPAYELRVRMTPVAVLAGKEPHTPARQATVVALAGGFAVAPLDIPYQIGLFDSAGGWLRAVGTKGRGPGEFMYVASLHGARGDSILAFDRAAARIAVLGPDLRFGRTLLPVPGSLTDLEQTSVGGFVVRVVLRERASHCVSWTKTGPK